MKVTPGSADVTSYFSMRLAATGAEATGLTIADMDLQYVRSGEVPAAKVDAVALAATNTAHTDNRAIEIDATDQPGLYRVDWPDAAFAASAREVILSVKCALCFTEHLRVELETIQTGDSFARIGATGSGLTTLASQASVTTIDDFLDAEIATILADLDDLQTRIPAALVSGRIDANVGAMAAGTLTATAIAADAITAAKVADGAIDAATFAAGAIDATAIAAGAITSSEAPALANLDATVSSRFPTAGYTAPLDAAGTRAAVGLASATTDTQLAALQADTNDLQARIPAVLIGGRLDASLGAINGTVASALNLERSTQALVRGSITGASTTTSLVDSSLTQAATDHFKGRIVIFTSGALALQATEITAFTPATDTLTVVALTGAPSVSDTYVIV